MTFSNPAALQGWVKSTDPKTGRTFYANHVTRKTQWEKPDGWVDEPVVKKPTLNEDDGPLPPNWEVMHDPTTGKPFYVDHQRQITQWTRPVLQESNSYDDAHAAFRPAVATPPASGNRYSTITRNSSNNSGYENSYSSYQQHSATRSYQQEALYYSQPSTSNTDVDLSDSMPTLEFKVQTVADALRPECPHCDAIFSISKRRHHCRLCGDVFCDACSNHRCTLPLPGPEFEKPVRVCDFCFTDVDQGNFFSMRRYLTVLHLYDPDSSTEDESGVATASNVNAALSALTQDLDQMVHGAENMEEKVTIPPEILLPEILKHLHPRDTADRAVRCIASLLSLENVAGKTDYTTAMYLYGKKASLADLLHILERSGSDRKTLFVQEQAARVLFYLSESKIIAAVTAKRAQLSSKNDKEDYGTVEDSLDIPRSIRNMLDHASSSGNPNLQRWAAATLKNLILEDQRRACLAVNEVAALAASGERPGAPSYTSHLTELVSTGGIMILGSLIGADDADTRAHAVTALGATLISTRNVDNALSALAEMTGGEYGRTNQTDGDIVKAIVAAGGCSGSVAQLMLSAENDVAGMGCSFLSSLVKPLLADAVAGGTLPRQYDYQSDQSSMGAYREAAVEIATGSCLPALLSLVRSDSRPMELRLYAMETVAATVSSIGEMGRSWAAGEYEEGLERYHAPTKLKEAIVMLNEEGVIDCALHILQSSLGQSLGSSDSVETPAARIRECAGMLLSALTSCSAEAIMELQNKNILSSLLLASTDNTMTAPSIMRGDGSPRCLGVLETVAALLMFAWQHPSGSAKDLLDTLIEMIDAGAIPYVSRVMCAKVEWDSRDKAIGGMKGRAASCRLLCCLFGIALTDTTGIGMRRLMDAVDSDARSYKRSTNTREKRLPSNIVEATLGCLQTASTLAQKVLVGGAGANQQGEHYQSTVMDLVEASLLAAGSMCGSSIAPGGSEGTLVTGESFLETRTDPYVQRRKEICNVTCDIVVRGGRSGATILPTMVVGGFGEGTVLASLRLALAVAQNGTNEQHAKLAMSGILVPISDLLRSALSGGDIYKFSSSLTLVRFCGPHVAAGQGGGLESVRDAIRVATNVLTLPVNPHATVKQMETQEQLKSECISALESLSRNASLWSSISTDALPSIVRYLHSTTAGGAASANPRGKATQCAALRAVLQIVQVPSHAGSAAEAGIVDPLGRILMMGKHGPEEDEVPMLALEVLHVIAKNQSARQKARFLQSGLVRSICSALGHAATETPKQPSDSRADVTFLGLEIILYVLSDVEGSMPIEQLLQSSGAIAFLDSVASEPKFVRAMCAALLVTTKMKLPRHDADNSGIAEFQIPKLYGPPLLYVPEKCGSYDSTHGAAEALLFTVAAYACALENQKSEAFWNTVLLQNDASSTDTNECLRTAATLSAYFLSLLTNDHKAFIPRNAQRHGDYLSITRPLVRHRLLDALRDAMADLSGEGDNESDPYMTSVLVAYNVPHTCLSLWRDPALLDVAFELIKQIVEQDPDEVLHLFVEGKEAIMSLFDLLNLDANFEGSSNVGDIRSFLASILGQLAENGLLKEAVERYEVRSSAIAALAAACLSEEERPPDEDEDMTSTRLSTVLMRCLVDLCSVSGKSSSEKKRIQLASAEATAIAKNLGKKICHMVLSRFLERSKLQQFEMDDDENITDAPDVMMLCAVAQHEEALMILRSIGGLHALSLVAAEGEITALTALQKACSGDANVLLEGDTYISMMNLISSDEHDADWKAESPSWKKLETSAFELLGKLCSGSTQGRNAVAGVDTCADCISRAKEIVIDLSGVSPKVQGDEEMPLVTEDSDSDMEENEAKQPKVEEEEHGTKLSEEDYVLGAAACFFLASLSSAKIAWSSMRSDEHFILGLSRISREIEHDELLLSALKLMTSLAHVSSNDEPLSAELLGDLFISILESKRKVKTTASINSNRFYHHVISGLNVVYDDLSLETQKKAATHVASLFLKSVKGCIITKSTVKEDDRAYAAELAYALTLLLQVIRGRPFVNDIFSSDMMTALVQLVLWKQDPKTSLGNMNKIAWAATTTNCLLLLSSLIWRSVEVLEASGVDLQKLSGTTLMLARPGKAPRKAIDFKSALDRFVAGQDPAAAAASERIIARLF